MIKITFTIMGKNWELRLLKRKKHTKKNGADTLAVTKHWKRTIDLGPEGLDKETIVHELVHGFLAEMCIKTSDPTVEVMEEVFCELMSKRGRELLDLADALDDTVKRLTLSV